MCTCKKKSVKKRAGSCSGQVKVLSSKGNSLINIDSDSSVQLFCQKADHQSSVHSHNLDVGGEVIKVKGNADKSKVFGRCFYNSMVDKKEVQGLLVRGPYKKKIMNFVSGHRILGGYSHGCDNSVKVMNLEVISPTRENLGNVAGGLRLTANQSQHEFDRCENVQSIVNHSAVEPMTDHEQGKVGPINKSLDSRLVDTKVHTLGGNTSSADNLDKFQANKGSDETCACEANKTPVRVKSSANTGVLESRGANVDEYCLLFDVNGNSSDFIARQYSTSNNDWKKYMADLGKTCVDFRNWRSQSDFTFGFVPLSNLVVNKNLDHVTTGIYDPIQQHRIVKATGIPNYLGARIQVNSQLNLDEWDKILQNYWDQQLLQLLRFGFPLDFNRNCSLRSDNKNHSSAVDFPQDVNAYLSEEKQHKAIIGPFKIPPIENAHASPLMTREKPNASNRRVIVDLSWPKQASVNDGVDKNSYLGSEFALTFPTIDNITQRLVSLGKGAHIYKIDISRAFRHLKMDPGDLDLLTLCWDGAYIDTCLPFGSRHGSQNFQRVSDAVRYAMRLRQFCVINYIDDFVGMGVPDVAQESFKCLSELLQRLGLTISESKLIPPPQKLFAWEYSSIPSMAHFPSLQKS